MRLKYIMIVSTDHFNYNNNERQKVVDKIIILIPSNRKRLGKVMQSYFSNTTGNILNINFLN